ARRRAGGHRRAVRRVQGAARRLHQRRVREHRARRRDRRAVARRAPLRDGGAPRDGHGRGRDVSADAAMVEDLLRSLAPQVLGVLVRRYGRFGACEDAVQEALLAAALQWPDRGVPESPRGWLVTVASRRLADEARSESARRRREDAAAAQAPPAEAFAPPPGEDAPPEDDDTLTLLFLCCHPALSAPSQVALTLRAVGGLSTAQIAAAFLVPEATMAQR